MTELGNAAAIAKYFGKKQGQNLKELMEEIQALTEADKQELGPLCRDALAMPAAA